MDSQRYMDSQGLWNMDPQRLSYRRVNSRLFHQNKENFDPINRTFAGTLRNNNHNRRSNSKLTNYTHQRHHRDPLTEIFINTYQQEDAYIVVNAEPAAVEITTTREAPKRKKRSRTTKPATKPRMESLLKLR